MTNDLSKNKRNVPPLRFPEFTGEWNLSTIGVEFDLYSGNTPSRLDKQQFMGKVNWISSGELKEHYISSTKEKITEVAANNNNLKILPIGTFIIAIYGLEAEGVRGTCSITKEASAISQACMAFMPKGNVTNEFLYSWYKKHGNLIGIRYAQGTKQQNLSYDIISQFRISFPSAQEQAKLERFISLLDERIATQNKIIEDYKKLIGGIVVDHYNKCQEKQTTRISELGEPFSVGLLSKEDLVKNGMPCILYGDLFTVYDCIANEIHNKTNKIYNQVHSIGDELLFPASTTVDAVSLISPTALTVAGVILGGDMFGIHISKEYNAVYISYVLNYVYKCQLAKFAQGSTIIHLHYKDIAQFELTIPPLTQQVKLKDLLYLLQCKIANEQLHLSLLTQQRKFLLSQLFI